MIFIWFHMLVISFICLPLSDLTSLSVTISRSSVLLQVPLFHSFLWLSNIPLYIYIFFIHSSMMDICFLSIYWLFYIVLQWILGYMYLLESWFSLDQCPGVGSVGFYIFLCFHWRTCFVTPRVVGLLFLWDTTSSCSPPHWNAFFSSSLMGRLKGMSQYVMYCEQIKLFLRNGPSINDKSIDHL